MGEKRTKGSVGRVRLVDSFFDGVPAVDATYIHQIGVGQVAFPLVAGATTRMYSIIVPSGTYWDVTGIEYFITVPDGAGGWVDAPSNKSRFTLAFTFQRNGLAAIEGNVTDPNGAVFTGTDETNTNILRLFGDTPIHVVCPGGSRLTAQCEVINPTMPRASVKASPEAEASAVPASSGSVAAI